jgi:hypothetical protein
LSQYSSEFTVLYIKCSVRIWAGTPATLLQIIRDFPVFVQANIGKIIMLLDHDNSLPNSFDTASPRYWQRCTITHKRQ